MQTRRNLVYLNLKMANFINFRQNFDEIDELNSLAIEFDLVLK